MKYTLTPERLERRPILTCLEPIIIAKGERRNLTLPDAVKYIAIVENATGLDASHKRDFDKIKFLIDNPQLN